MAYSEFSASTPCAELTPTSTGDDLYRVGLMYSEGVGVDADLIEAHKWFNLAAIRGSADAKTLRREIAEQMCSDEIAKAQRAAREWLNLMN